MNILIFNWRDLKNEWAGGGEVYIFELAKRWIKLGHKVTLFCGQDIRDTLPEQEIINGIHIIRKGGRYSLYLWAVWYYITRLRQHTDIIVDVQNGIPFFTPIYSRKPKVSVVYHVHGKQFFIELPFPLSIFGYVMERFLFPLFYRTLKIIAISETTKKELQQLGFLSKNIHIVYCGINGKDKKVSKSRGKFLQPTLLYLGRIKKYKRVDLLIKIMPKILQKAPNARLLIAGWGTEASAVIDMSMRSIIRRRVKIIGPVSETEKKHLLTKSWIFINPSIGEGWGISVIEANLYGTPAIAFRVNGLSESIKDKKTGFLVKSEDELIEKIIMLIKNKKLRVSMNKTSREWAEKFNWDDAAKKSLKIILQEKKNYGWAKYVMNKMKMNQFVLNIRHEQIVKAN